MQERKRMGGPAVIGQGGDLFVSIHFASDTNTDMETTVEEPLVCAGRLIYENPMTSKNADQTCAEEREKLDLLQPQIAEADSRLGTLYDALETGEFKGGELASRIQALFEKKEELQQVKADAEEALRYQAVDMADPLVVRDYVDDLRGLLERSSIIEQRSFLKSFVDRIEVGDSEVNMYYTIPMPPSSLPEETVGVIPFVHHG